MATSFFHNSSQKNKLSSNNKLLSSVTLTIACEIYAYFFLERETYCDT